MRTRILVMTAITPILALSLMGCQTATKSLGGNTTLELEPNEKLGRNYLERCFPLRILQDQ